MYRSYTTKNIFVVIFIALLSGTGCSLQKTQAVGSLEQQTQTVGWIEKARIPGVETQIKAKLDTGATTTSINAEILEKPDKDSESGGMIKFRFLDGEGNQEVFERPIVRWVSIKSREGADLRRPVVRMKLLIVPRLAAILTATVLVVGFLAIIMENLGINLGLSVSLFPIVILAMTIERAAVTWEEEGPTETIIAGLGSILAAVIGYFCMINDYVQHWAFVFPELLLLVLAVNILVGRYNGYKVIEYFRFLSLQRQLNQTEG